MSPQEREKLARLRPKSKVEKFENKLEGKQSTDEMCKKAEITELPECAVCSAFIGLQKCPCKLVYYCGTECQSKDWKDHKVLHKKAMSKMKKR